MDDVSLLVDLLLRIKRETILPPFLTIELSVLEAARLPSSLPPLLTEQIRIDNNRNRWHAVKQILGEVCRHHNRDSSRRTDSTISVGRYDAHCGNIGISLVCIPVARNGMDGKIFALRSLLLRGSREMK